MKPSSIDDQLIDSAKREPAAFAQLYTKYRKSLFRFFWYRLHDVEQSSDMVQETFLRAFSKLKAFRLHGFSYNTYLRRIGTNLLTDLYRKPKHIELEAADNVSDTRTDTTNVIDAQLVWEKARQLSADEQEILKFFYQQQLSINNISTKLQVSHNAVKLRLVRARRKLKKLHIVHR